MYFIDVFGRLRLNTGKLTFSKIARSLYWISHKSCSYISLILYLINSSIWPLIHIFSPQCLSKLFIQFHHFYEIIARCILVAESLTFSAEDVFFGDAGSMERWSTCFGSFNFIQIWKFASSKVFIVTHVHFVVVDVWRLLYRFLIDFEELLFNWRSAWLGYRIFWPCWIDPEWVFVWQVALEQFFSSILFFFNGGDTKHIVNRFDNASSFVMLAHEFRLLLKNDTAKETLIIVLIVYFWRFSKTWLLCMTECWQINNAGISWSIWVHPRRSSRTSSINSLARMPRTRTLWNLFHWLPHFILVLNRL